jgi:regulator of sigma E protease
MNVLLAWILLSIGYAVGLPVAINSTQSIPHGSRLLNQRIAIIDIVPEGPASKEGFQVGDSFISVDGRSFETTEQLQAYIAENKGKAFAFKVQRGDEVVEKNVQSNAQPAPNQGATGIALAQVGQLRFPVHRAIWEGATTTVSQLGAIVKGLYEVFTSKQGVQSLGGPVKIAQITGQVADLGAIYLLQFTAFLSLNLAILNALPFPALDGGRVLFLLIEKVRGKRNNQAIEQWANTIGFMLLLLLMLLVTVRDVRGL